MKIFLSVSFSAEVDEKGNVQKAYRSDLETLIQKLEELGHKVYCALAEEKWTINNQNPVSLLKKELEKIDDSDIFVAVLGHNISCGVQLSMGYALAKEKRLVIASTIGAKHGWVNSALSGLENISSLNFEFYDELGTQIQELISR